MDTILQDIRYGIRTLLKSPGFTVTAILSLALGIGANTAIFSIIDALMLRQLPVHDPARLVLFGQGRDAGESDGIQAHVELISEPSLAEIQKEPVFAGAAGILSLPLTLHPFIGGASANEPLKTRLVSGNYFSLLGVNPAVGRLFTADDDAPRGAHPDLVISYNYWRKRFAGRREALGTTMHIGEQLFTVIGVAAPEFFGTMVGESPDAWLPLSMESTIPPYWTWHGNMDQCLHVIARLKPGVTLSQAAAAEKLLLQRLLRSYAGTSPSRRDIGQIDRISLDLTPAANGLSDLRHSYSVPLEILMVVVGLVLLIACANVANLLLARATMRQREMAVRFAVGSGRARVIRQLLTESILLSSAGGLLGILFAMWGSQILVSLVSSGPDAVALNVDPNLRVLAFTLAVSLLTGIIFGLAPAFRASSVDPIAGLREGRSGTATRSRMFSSRALVVFQVALSLLLLIGAGLFVRSFRNLEDVDTGFNRNDLVLFSVDTDASGLKENARLAAFYQRAEHEIDNIPGVKAVSFSMFFFNQGAWTASFNVEAHPETVAGQKELTLNITGPEYLKATGIRLIEGRYFGPGDTSTAPKVAVLNEQAEHAIFGKQPAIGKRLHLGEKDAPFDIEIVGVVANAKYLRLQEEPRWAGYLPYAQNTQYLGNLLVRTEGNPAAAVAQVRRVIGGINANLPISQVTNVSEFVDRSLQTQHLIARLSTFFGLLALLLAALGLHGILSYSVAQRTNEIGLRMALGAQSARVLWMILRETLLLIGVGILIGVPAAVLTSRLIQSILFGVKASDALTIGAAVLVLVAIGSFAGFLPARRASQVDPMVALRYE